MTIMVADFAHIYFGTKKVCEFLYAETSFHWENFIESLPVPTDISRT